MGMGKNLLSVGTFDIRWAGACCEKYFGFVATNIILSQQKFSRDKHTFVTKGVFCRDKTKIFFAASIFFVVTNVRLS